MDQHVETDAMAMFAAGRSINAVANLLGLTWYDASKLQKAFKTGQSEDSCTKPAPPDQQDEVPVVEPGSAFDIPPAANVEPSKMTFKPVRVVEPEQPEPADYHEIVISLSARKFGAVFSTFTADEQGYAISAVLQQRLDKAIEDFDTAGEGEDDQQAEGTAA